MGNLIPAEVVYRSWFAHEQKKDRNVLDEHAAWFIKQELPRRARWPGDWYRCQLESARAADLLVGAGWKGWTEWSLPEGSYLRIAERIAKGDPAIQPETAERIRKLAVALESEISPLFGEDPLVLRGPLLTEPLTVIEGHHRTAAVALATLNGRCLPPFIAFIGTGPRWERPPLAKP